MSPQTIEQQANNYVMEFGTPPPDEEEESLALGETEETNTLTVSIRRAYVRHATIISAIEHADDLEEFEDEDEQGELITELRRLERHAKSHHQMLCQLYLEQVREARDDALFRECQAFHLANEAEEAELAAQYENYEYDGEAEEDDSFALGETDDSFALGETGEYEAPEEGETYEDEDDEDEAPPPPVEHGTGQENLTNGGTVQDVEEIIAEAGRVYNEEMVEAHLHALRDIEACLEDFIDTDFEDLSNEDITEIAELREMRLRHVSELAELRGGQDSELSEINSDEDIDGNTIMYNQDTLKKCKKYDKIIRRIIRIIIIFFI